MDLVSQFIFVFAGFLAGTMAGLLPGVGLLTTLTIVYPLLKMGGITELILFYMSLAATVQYVGTVPSVFIGIPGETNSAPAVQEGVKFSRHGNADIAVGVCAIGSVIGAVVSVAIFYWISGYALETFGTVVSNRFRSILYLIVILCFVLFFNQKRILINIGLIAVGLWLGMVGSNPLTEEFRFTFGIRDLRWGLDIMPMISGLIVIPALVQRGYTYQARLGEIRTSFVRPWIVFLRNWPSSIRGSVVGFVCGLVPGITTILATSMSHTLENKLHPNKPVRKIMSAETSNNSAQFASLIPLLMFGIPITGSEMFLYQMLIDAGWIPSELNNLSANISMIFVTVLPWFVLVNLMGLLVSWPLAKQAMFFYRLEYKYIVSLVLTVIVAVILYVGWIDHRMISYILQTVFAGIIGFSLHRYNLLPMFTAYILSNDIESVFVREIMFAKIYLGI